MNTQFTITIAGHDKPKFMNQLAATTHSLGGKWLVSKLTRLDNQVVGIIRIDIPNIAADQLKQDLLAFDDYNVRIIDEPSPAQIEFSQAILKVESKDRPGLIHDITQCLDDMGIQTLRMENHRLGIPEAGETVFFAELEVEIPTEVQVEQLVDAVESIQPQLKVAVH